MQFNLINDLLFLLFLIIMTALFYLFKFLPTNTLADLKHQIGYNSINFTNIELKFSVVVADIEAQH